MDDEDFRDTLEAFADAATDHRAEWLVIDVREFRHRPSAEILAWRDQVTVGKYNAAEVKRLAWIWPGDVSSMKPSSENRSYMTSATSLPKKKRSTGSSNKAGARPTAVRIYSAALISNRYAPTTLAD